MQYSDLLRNFALVRTGLRSLNAETQADATLTVGEIEAALALFYLREFVGNLPMATHPEPELRRMYDLIRNRAQQWNIHVLESDALPESGKPVLGKALRFQHRQFRSAFPDLPRNLKHLVLIRPAQSISSKYVTLLHELGHVVLGHCGPRASIDKPTCEVEAELTAFLASRRSGFTMFRESARYLCAFTEKVQELSRSKLGRIGVAVCRLDALVQAVACMIPLNDAAAAAIVRRDIANVKGPSANWPEGLEMLRGPDGTLIAKRRIG